MARIITLAARRTGREFFATFKRQLDRAIRNHSADSTSEGYKFFSGRRRAAAGFKTGDYAVIRNAIADTDERRVVRIIVTDQPGAKQGTATCFYSDDGVATWPLQDDALPAENLGSFDEIMKIHSSIVHQLQRFANQHDLTLSPLVAVRAVVSLRGCREAILSPKRIQQAIACGMQEEAQAIDEINQIYEAIR